MSVDKNSISPETAKKTFDAAFFDVDNTLIRGASLFQVAKGLHERKFFTYRDLLSVTWKQLRFRAVGENLNHLQAAQETALQFVAGHSRTEIEDLSEEIYDTKIIKKIWPGTQSLVNKHLQAGRKVWLVTGTPVDMAKVIAKRLGLDGALGTVGQLEGGIYTGKLVGKVLHGQAKADAVEALAKESNFNLSNCWAYSDSANDIPLLSLVGHPVAVNPDKKLLQYAVSRGWEVYDFRRGRKSLILFFKVSVTMFFLQLVVRVVKGRKFF